MATDAKSLLSAANCYLCEGSNPMSLEAMKVVLLAQILQSKLPSADVTPQTLLKNANCYLCYGPNPYSLQLMELALLAQIVNS